MARDRAVPLIGAGCVAPPVRRPLSQDVYLPVQEGAAGVRRGRRAAHGAGGIPRFQRAATRGALRDPQRVRFGSAGLSSQQLCPALSSRAGLDIRQNFSTQGVVRRWHRLPRLVVDVPSLEAFKARLNGALGCLLWWLQPTHRRGTGIG